MSESHIHTVLTIDDHPLFRKGVSDLIGMEPSLKLVGEAAHGQEGLLLAQQVSPDLILLDINMKGMGGIETLRALKKSNVDSVILMLTVSDNEEDVLSALRIGADGYLLKDMEPEDILESMRKALQGTLVISERLTQLLAKALREEKEISGMGELTPLTSREQEILEQIANGMTNRRIAEALNISEGTVKVHVKNLLKKLNLHSRTEAAVWALRRL
ncbi:MAG: two-component system response regulator NarL [Candidatus Thiodiazotropha sp.]